ncbi:MAG: hypothetical protein KBT82_18575 [Marinobacter sp.]|uniref:hypothetical protein n=1 Tax=Marinobacter sp. TaxID=50741 RepID=UPI001B68317B|nr:hypothetical protein [Marinobacter sp.]MBQ0745365.1 hypothetical protein [Marinobacter sp.]MBQ0816146.1 hypothetical protein [Marinobacter sp.]|tara:strand:- start:1288 stop:2658 length:1371 start_codon:yes stop_codon:yes gene_type:complete
MERRSGSANKYSLAAFYVGTGFVGAFCVAWPSAATAQSLSDSVKTISGSASVFTGVTHTRTDRGASTDTNTEPSVGLAGRVGGTFESGANALALQYGGTLETRRDTADGDQTDRSSIIGASRYTYFDPGSRLDFNLGHTVSSVRNDTGFVVNPSSYDTRNTLSAGAGLRFYPGELSTLRFFSQAGRSFGGGAFNDQESYTVGSELSRRLSERSTGSLNVSRSWSDGRGTDITIDSAQLVYSLQLESGYFSIGAGGSQAETEFAGGTTSESDAVTGFVERAWVTTDWRTLIKYDRSMSDSATDLSLNLPPDFSFLPNTVRLQDLVVRDSLSITHNNQQVCDACNLGIYAAGAILESQISGATTHEYRAGVNLSFQLTSLQRLNFGYSWQGDADEDANVIVDQIHRFTTVWTRQLAENTSFGVQFNQSYLRSKSVRNDQDQFELRLVLSRGFSMSGRR